MAHNPEPCEVCGLTYERFRTGLRFADIVNMLWVDDQDSTRWRQKRRHSVLGFWRETKLRMWDEHVALCKAARDNPVELHEMGPIDDF